MVRYFLIILVVVSLYLNRAYAYFYDYIGDKNLIRTASRNLEVGEKPNKSFFRYVSLGDSLTAGVGAISATSNYPYLVAKKINQSGPTVELYNYSDPGAKISDVLNFQLNLGILENPDLVTLLIGINDIHNTTDEEIFKKNYQKIISELKKQTHARIVLINIPYLGSDKILLFPYNLLFDLKTKSFNNSIKDLANLNQLEYIDLYTKTRSQLDSDPTLYSTDYFHPSDKGYILWGQIINANLSF